MQIYGYSVKTVDSRTNIYADFSWNMRITLFKKVMGHLDQLLRLVPQVFETYKPCFKSDKLRRLCSLKPILLQGDGEANQGVKQPNEFSPIEADDGLLDNFLPLLEPFESSIVWCASAHHYMLPRPVKGLDQRIDKVCEKIDIYKESLKQFLQQTRTFFESNSINFVHNKRY